MPFLQVKHIVLLCQTGLSVAVFSQSSLSCELKLSAFEAVNSGNIVHFKWDVMNESNVSHYVIQKSIDSCKTWSNVAKVSAIDAEGIVQTYERSEICIKEVLVEQFRLTAVDENNMEKHLDSVIIYQPSLSNLKMIPDPKKPNELITVCCESMVGVDAHLMVYDSDGELILEKEMPLSSGYNRLELSLKKLVPGEYRLQVRDHNENVLTKRLVVH